VFASEEEAGTTGARRSNNGRTITVGISSSSALESNLDPKFWRLSRMGCSASVVKFETLVYRVAMDGSVDLRLRWISDVLHFTLEEH